MLLATEIFRSTHAKSKDLVEAASTMFDNTGGPHQTHVIDTVSLMAGIPTALFSRTVDPEAIYRSNPWHFAVVNLIARGWGRMPAKVYELDSDGDKIRSTSPIGRELELALRFPGRSIAAPALRRATAIDKLVHGNALWVLESNRRGQLEGIERIPWVQVSVVESGGEIIYRDKRSPNDKGRRWGFDEVVHFGYGEGDSVVAPSPVQSLRSSLALYDAVITHLLSYLGRSARPGGTFKVDPHLAPEVLDQVTAEIAKFYAGAQNAGRVLITSAEWQATSDSPGDSGLSDLAKASREEICAVYAVSPPLVGILEKTLMNTVKELREHTTRDTVGPYAQDLDSTIVAQIRDKLPRYAEVWTESDSSASLAGDIESRAASWPNQLRIRTPNELRQVENLKPLDDPNANRIWAPNDTTASSTDLGPEALAAMLQKLYLGVGTVITMDEARTLLESAGWDLTSVAPTPETKDPAE